jgi:uncharacterized PurR-regulated membrane protein YhhQ (DUF165 family)
MRRPPLERRSALKPSPGPARTAPMKRGRRGRHTAQQATARAAWKLATVGRPCAVCGVGWGWGSSAAQPLDGHHVLRREFIERTLRRKGAPVSPEVLYDLRNQLVLCRGCHDAHEGGDRLPRELVPAAAWEFRPRVGCAGAGRAVYGEVGVGLPGCRAKGGGVRAVLVLLVLSTVVAANLISAKYGPEASIYNAFVLVGVVLSTKDWLYDLWGEKRIRNTALLVAAGSALSYLAAITLTPASVPAPVVKEIAFASFAAYAVAETWDTVVYHWLRERPWLERSNTSNVLGAFLDSAVFVTLAFGWAWPIIFGQFCAKVAGGFVWSLVIEKVRERRLEPEFA